MDASVGAEDEVHRSRRHENQPGLWTVSALGDFDPQAGVPFELRRECRRERRRKVLDDHTRRCEVIRQLAEKVANGLGAAG